MKTEEVVHKQACTRLMVQGCSLQESIVNGILFQVRQTNPSTPTLTAWPGIHAEHHLSGHTIQSATETTIVAENATLVYGSSVYLDISAVSANAAYVNLSSQGIYTGYIYGGDLPDGFSIKLYSQFSEENSAPHWAIAFINF